MARLPIIDGDDGDWGIVLNDYLEVSLSSDGTLNPNVVADAQVSSSAAINPTKIAGTAETQTNKNQASGYAGLNSSGFVPVALLPANIPIANLNVTGTPSSSNYLRGDGTWAVPNSGSSTLASDTDVTLTSPTNNQVLTYNTGTSKWVNQAAPTAANATSSTPGLIQLTGDIGGTATSPTVAKVNGVTLPVSAPAAGNVLTASSSTATTWTTPAAGVTLDSTATDIQPDTTTGTAVAGATGKAADAGHQHTLVTHDHTTANKGGNIPVGGLSATGTASSSTYLRGDGTWTTPNSGSSTLAADTDVTIASPANNQVLTYNTGTSKWVNQNAPSASNATTSTPGLVQLSGDLGGTATSPSVAKVNGVAVSGTPSNGQVITASSSSAASWTTPTSGAQALVPTAVKTANYTASAADFVLCDTNSVGAFTVTLPTAPADKTRVAIKLVAVGTTSGQPNALSFVTGGSDKFNTTTGPTTGSLTLLNQAVNLQYISATSVWVVASDDLPMSQTDLRYERSAAAAVATTNIAATYSSNSFAPTSATTIDGYTFAANDLILLTGQTSGVQNGLWLVPSSGAWTRPTEFASGAIVRGRTVPIMNGTTNINTQWDLNVPTAGITVDTTSQTWKMAFNGTYAPVTVINVTQSPYNFISDPSNGSGSSTYDNTAGVTALAAYLNGLTSGQSARVYFPAGYYWSSTTSTITNASGSTISFEGAGKIATKWGCAPASAVSNGQTLPLFFFSACSNLRFTDIGFDGNFANCAKNGGFAVSSAQFPAANGPYYFLGKGTVGTDAGAPAQGTQETWIVTHNATLTTAMLPAAVLVDNGSGAECISVTAIQYNTGGGQDTWTVIRGLSNGFGSASTATHTHSSSTIGALMFTANYLVYASGTGYNPGQIVQYQNQKWMAVQSTTGNAPSTASSYWTLVNDSIFEAAWATYGPGSALYTASGGNSWVKCYIRSEYGIDSSTYLQYQCCVRLDNCHDFMFERCDFSNASSAGALINGPIWGAANNGTFVDTTGRFTWDNNIYLHYGCVDMYIYAHKARDIQYSAIADLGGARIHYYNCSATNCGPSISDSFGLAFAGTKDGVMVNPYALNCQILGGIGVENASYGDNTTAIGGDALVQDNAQRCKIYNPVVEWCHNPVDLNGVGIIVFNADDTEIYNPSCQFNDCGIQVPYGAKHTKIFGGNVSFNYGYGINLGNDANSFGTLVKGVVLEQNVASQYAGHPSTWEDCKFRMNPSSSGALNLDYWDSGGRSCTYKITNCEFEENGGFQTDQIQNNGGTNSRVEVKGCRFGLHETSFFQDAFWVPGSAYITSRGAFLGTYAQDSGLTVILESAATNNTDLTTTFTQQFNVGCYGRYANSSSFGPSPTVVVAGTSEQWVVDHRTGMGAGVLLVSRTGEVVKVTAVSVNNVTVSSTQYDTITVTRGFANPYGIGASSSASPYGSTYGTLGYTGIFNLSGAQLTTTPSSNATGTASAVTVTSITTSGLSSGAYNNQRIYMGGVYGNIISNSTTNVTIDGWWQYDFNVSAQGIPGATGNPATPGATPSTGTFYISYGTTNPGKMAIIGRSQSLCQGAIYKGGNAGDIFWDGNEYHKLSCEYDSGSSIFSNGLTTNSKIGRNDGLDQASATGVTLDHVNGVSGSIATSGSTSGAISHTLVTAPPDASHVKVNVTPAALVTAGLGGGSIYPTTISSSQITFTSYNSSGAATDPSSTLSFTFDADCWTL